jgi:AraC-like DNA-binding protein
MIIKKELENSSFHITDLSEKFNLSRPQFQRKINMLTGLSPKQYKQEIALQNGRELMGSNVYANVTAVSYTVGISNPSRFSDMYEKKFGKRPNDYFRKIESIRDGG